jgi:hypothetical protein
MFEVLTGPGLNRLATPIEEEFGGWEVLGAVTDLAEREYKNQALETKSFRSGDFYRNIHRVGQSYEVLSDIGYGDIIETQGWPTQGPRFPAQKAVEAIGPDVEKVLSDAAIKAAIATITGASAPDSQIIKRFVFDPNDDNWVALLKATSGQVNSICIYYDGIDEENNKDTAPGTMDVIIPFGFVFYRQYEIGTDADNSEKRFMADIAAAKWDLAASRDLGMSDVVDENLKGCVANHRGLNVPRFSLKIFGDIPVMYGIGRFEVEMQSQVVRGG